MSKPTSYGDDDASLAAEARAADQAEGINLDPLIKMIAQLGLGNVINKKKKKA